MNVATASHSIARIRARKTLNLCFQAMKKVSRIVVVSKTPLGENSCQNHHDVLFFVFISSNISSISSRPFI
uniref:Uncharacterized protein n=1 Tax=Candidatus Methanophaga sp. ANME-1 ERB7 TaxID=2759913 RepID=A0A7G9Z2J1_9EURY|nr:hypothetical protein ILIMKHIM_00004 [Methanosarcinales archaeon ANME-1 ERB7]